MNRISLWLLISTRPPGTGYSVFLLTSITESCDEDDDVRVGVDRWSSGRYTHDLRRASQQKDLREFSLRNITVNNRSNS